MALRLTEECPEDIGFIESCLFTGAINLKDLERWAEHILKTESEFPDYIYSLASPHRDASFHDIIGFVPHAPDLSTQEMIALHAIGIIRGSDVKWPALRPVSRKAAFRELLQNSHIMEKYRNLFPFISINWSVIES